MYHPETLKKHLIGDYSLSGLSDITCDDLYASDLAAGVSRLTAYANFVVCRAGRAISGSPTASAVSKYSVEQTTTAAAEILPTKIIPAYVSDTAARVEAQRRAQAEGAARAQAEAESQQRLAAEQSEALRARVEQERQIQAANEAAVQQRAIEQDILRRRVEAQQELEQRLRTSSDPAAQAAATRVAAQAETFKEALARSLSAPPPVIEMPALVVSTPIPSPPSTAASSVISISTSTPATSVAPIAPIQRAAIAASAAPSGGSIFSGVDWGGLFTGLTQTAGEAAGLFSQIKTSKVEIKAVKQQLGQAVSQHPAALKSLTEQTRFRAAALAQSQAQSAYYVKLGATVVGVTLLGFIALKVVGK
jgi:hypothetical protein